MAFLRKQNELNKATQEYLIIMRRFREYIISAKYRIHHHRIQRSLPGYKFFIITSHIFQRKFVPDFSFIRIL